MRGRSFLLCAQYLPDMSCFPFSRPFLPILAAVVFGAVGAASAATHYVSIQTTKFSTNLLSHFGCVLDDGDIVEVGAGTEFRGSLCQCRLISIEDDHLIIVFKKQLRCRHTNAASTAGNQRYRFSHAGSPINRDR